MAEYIDKQAAIGALGEEPENWIDAEFDLGTQDQWRCDVEAIKAVPPADVQPVVRGRWEVVDWVECDGHGECVHYPKEGLRCTNCKNVFKKKLLWKDNYCPNCGADMREGDAK